ncbi:MAG: mandelate racemase/muconate lactonizing enzyme family protein [Bryobacteraceae bacterium]
MRIKAIETIEMARGIRVHAGPIQWMWVRIYTEDGLAGIGETYPMPQAAREVIHNSLAPLLIGRDPSEIDRLWQEMLLQIGYSGWAGAEMRAISAIDIALWDLAGKAANLPVYKLLGGASREATPAPQTSSDPHNFLTPPVELARSLAQCGIRAMKIWPFDPIARETGGQHITPDQLRRGIEPLRLIREELGDSMQVAMEFHGFWNLPCAIRIAQALEPLEPMWLEEMLPQDNLGAYRELARATRLPLCLSERLMTRWGFRELFENNAARIVMPDICWCGGISEAKKIAAMAETWYLPVAPHNCGGPVLHAASVHLAANVTNLYILETVRRHYLDEYNGLFTGLPLVKGGKILLPEGAGLGVTLNEEVLERDNIVVRRTE